ncbi:uncharacterized protein LOC142817436 isoform X2 [Rhipicephalus microplus]|uniref:uncharacterized protein LOC142817436 isoform X2 n=1 Tax=Rhipicephalus microplus TaxID=6941 RepID=UPI003F6BABA1
MVRYQEQGDICDDTGTYKGIASPAALQWVRRQHGKHSLQILMLCLAGGYGPDFAEDHVFGTHIGVDSHQNLQVRVKMPAPAGAHQDRIKEIHVATTAFA